MPGLAFTVALVLSCGLDVIVAGIVLRCLSRRRPITLPAVVAATAAAGTVFVAKVPALLALGFNGFGLIHAAYLDLVVALPLLAAAVLAHERWGIRGRSLTVAARGTTVLAVVAAPLAGVYASFIEPNHVQWEVTSVPVAAARAGSEPLRIGVLADIQADDVGRLERDAVDRMVAAAPDVILIPGDLFQGQGPGADRRRARLRAELARLSAPGGVYVVPGHCERTRPLEPLVGGLDIRVLDARIARVRVGDRALTIGGIGLDARDPAAREVLGELETAPGDDDIRILLAHMPDAVYALPPSSRVDLVVAGHTHGGQVCLPGFGPFLTMSRVPRRVCAGGLHDLDGRLLYVSRGIGHERGQAPPLRFMCPPEVTLLTVGGGPTRSPG